DVRVAHAELPRLPGTGFREVVDGAQHVPRLEVQQRPLGDGRIVVDRYARVVPVRVQVPQQPYDVPAHEVGLERPGRVGVADGEREVGYAAEHHALVRHGFREVDVAAVHGERDPAEGEQLESGGGDDDVRREFGAGLQAHPGPGELRDPVGHHGHPVPADRVEEVTVRDAAQPLVPRVVPRLEVGVDVVAGRHAGH